MVVGLRMGTRASRKGFRPKSGKALGVDVVDVQANQLPSADKL